MLVEQVQLMLSEYRMDLPESIVVFGDASASMEVVIKTSSIITSLLTSIAKADLHLFRNVDHQIENPPCDVQFAIKFGAEMRVHKPYSNTEKIRLIHTWQDTTCTQKAVNPTGLTAF